MKLYKRMIRPMVDPPLLQGFSDEPYPLFSDDYWVSEDYEEILTNTWKELVKKKDSWADLKIDEKYVEVDFSEPTPVKIIDNNLVCFIVDINKMDFDVACEYVKRYTEILPNEIGVLTLPSIEPKVLDKDTVDAFIDDYKRKVEEKYK